jgi:Uma2 family endonuclease
MSNPLESKNDYFTYADYKNWPDDERWEIIDGEAYSMSPSPGRTHQQMVGEIATQLANFLEDKPCEVYAGLFDVFLPTEGESEDETSTVVQPDISIICDESKLSEKGCTGAPDIIIEVVSPYGRTRDQVKKMKVFGPEPEVVSQSSPAKYKSGRKTEIIPD